VVAWGWFRGYGGAFLRTCASLFFLTRGKMCRQRETRSDIERRMVRLHKMTAWYRVGTAHRFFLFSVSTPPHVFTAGDGDVTRSAERLHPRHRASRTQNSVAWHQACGAVDGGRANGRVAYRDDNRVMRQQKRWWRNRNESGARHAAHLFA